MGLTHQATALQAAQHQTLEVLLLLFLRPELVHQ
jgi:hypothetical protein